MPRLCVCPTDTRAAARRTGYQVFASCRVPELAADAFFAAAVRRIAAALPVRAPFV
jgi:hypothetical protein